MASILVFMNRRGAVLTPRSKRVLAQGRRIASHLGATLYAVAEENDINNDDWITEAGLAGADKIVLLSFGSSPSDASPEPSGQQAGLLAAALNAVSDALSPNLVLVDHDSTGPTLARAVARHLGALEFSCVQPIFTTDGDVVIEERSSDRRTRRLQSLTRSSAPIVATVSTARVGVTIGQDDADVIFFKAPRLPIALESDSALPTAAATVEQILDGKIVVGAGLDALPVLDEIRQLADLMKAPLVYTKELTERVKGHRDSQPRRVIDLSEHRIAPSLYLACGVGDTEEHLDAIAQGTQIVAFGTSPRATTVRAARYALLGDLNIHLPMFIQALGDSPPRPSDNEHYELTMVAAPANSSISAPCPDGPELFSAPQPLIEQLRSDRLWVS